MSCLGRATPERTFVDYLVGPIKDIPKADVLFFEQSKMCMVNDNEQELITQRNCLFVPNPSLPPRLQQVTFRKWKAGVSLGRHWNRWRRKRAIYIQPINDFPEFIETFRYRLHGYTKHGFIELLKDFTFIFFSGFRVVVLNYTYLDRNGWCVKHRHHPLTHQEQLLVTDLNRCLGNNLPKDASCILGLSWTDLYPCENLNFVMGEAAAEHCSAMFSFGRFQPKLYREGTPPLPLEKIDGNLIWKMIKVICHETCHVFLLSHCVFFDCLMNESSSVQEALEQPLFLCPVCLRKLQKVCKFNLKDRYQRMLDFLRAIHETFPSEKMHGSIVWLENCLREIDNNFV